MAHHLTTRFLPAAIMIVGAVTVSACGGPGENTKDAPPAAGPIPVITDPSQITLPTDAYLPTVAQVRQVVQAQDAVAAVCMREFGFAGQTTTLVGVDEEPRRRLTHSPLYGYFDVVGNQSKGYDNVLRPDQSIPAGSGPAHTPSVEEQIAFTGSGITAGQATDKINGKSVPPGGCSGKGRDTVGNAPIISDTSLPDGGPKIPTTDPRIVEAYAKWSACMRAKGYSYKDPVAANLDQKWHQPSETQQASTEQVATATADVECKLAGNTVGVVVAVQNAYAKQYVEANAAKLATFRQQTDDLLRRAAQVLAGSQG
ncbi:MULTISPECIES: hypothetical protein [unclassified Kitasatospora]|uniref:hypothetical protein n=1 Tax=unclassified Kitasatospora TaxID=2633591 RepID=UPI0037F69B1E